MADERPWWKSPGVWLTAAGLTFNVLLWVGATIWKEGQQAAKFDAVVQQVSGMRSDLGEFYRRQEAIAVIDDLRQRVSTLEKAMMRASATNLSYQAYSGPPRPAAAEPVVTALTGSPP